MKTDHTIAAEESSPLWEAPARALEMVEIFEKQIIEPAREKLARVTQDFQKQRQAAEGEHHSKLQRAQFTRASASGAAQLQCDRAKKASFAEFEKHRSALELAAQENLRLLKLERDDLRTLEQRHNELLHETLALLDKQQLRHLEPAEAAAKLNEASNPHPSEISEAIDLARQHASDLLSQPASHRVWNFDNPVATGFLRVVAIFGAIATAVLAIKYGHSSAAALGAGALAATSLYYIPLVGMGTYRRNLLTSKVREFCGTVASLKATIQHLQLGNKNASEQFENTLSAEISRLEEHQRDHRASLENSVSTAISAAIAAADTDIQKLEVAQAEALEHITSSVRHKLTGILEELESNAAASLKQWQTFQSKLGAAVDDWAGTTAASRASDYNFAARFGTFERDLSSLIPQIQGAGLSELLQGFRRRLGKLRLPALVPFPLGKALLFLTNGENRSAVNAAVHALCLRLLANIPAGKLLLSCLDPVGRGANLGPLLDLQDADLRLINGGIATEQAQMERCMEMTTQHMDFVIQKYLRTHYRTLRDYNQNSKDVEEPYRVILVFDFPTAFSQEASDRLLAIARHGERCGVYLVLVSSPELMASPNINAALLTEQCFSIQALPKDGPGIFRYSPPHHQDWILRLDTVPSAAIIREIVSNVSDLCDDAMRVIIPFLLVRQKLSDTKSSRWRNGSESWNSPWADAEGRDRGQTIAGVAIPIGQQGSRKIQWLEMGDELPHGIIIGSTGSGKSNLQHVMICALALKYSPEELELYLIDFKQGVEFKPYANLQLPHARVIAIESEREFAFSVIEALHHEMVRRGREVFRPLAVNSIGEYRKVTKEPMPRILLLIDEYQGFFKANDSIANEARRILEEMVREGRSCGIHVVLATQSLAGMAELPASILGQMELRLVLKCDEEDARVLLGEHASEARQLTRKGETLYRAKTETGLVCERFQAAFLSEEEKISLLKEVQHRQMLSGKPARVPLVFEGNSWAQLEECAPVRALLSNVSWEPATYPEACLGEPLAILGKPASAKLARQTGNNLLVLTCGESEGVGMLMCALISLIAQTRPGSTNILVVDLSTSEWSAHAESLSKKLEHCVRIIAKQRELANAIQIIAREVQSRIKESKSNPQIFIFIKGLQRAKILFEDADFDDSTSHGVPNGNKGSEVNRQFYQILRDGPEVGVHVLAWCDTRAALERIAPLNRILQFFATRVVTRLNESDSRTFIDNPAAAAIHKDCRAILYSETQPGRLQTFRPYRPPTLDWLQTFCTAVNARKT